VVLLDPQLTEFRVAVETAGLTGLLDGTMTVVDLSGLLGIDLQVELGLDPLLEDYTVFAPPNAVVQALPEWNAIKADPDAARRFVVSHIVPDSHLMADILSLTELTTLNDDLLTIDPVAQTVNGAHIVTPDITAPNGVLHTIDAFLIVPTLAPPVTTTVAPTTAAAADTDVDGLLDADELAIGTDPNNPDTDGDGLSDYDEYVNYGTSPISFDSDGDGVDDGTEVANGTNPIDPSSL
jgi:hypothetical protein